MYVVRIAYNSWSLQWLKTEFDTEVKRPYNFVMNCACDTKNLVWRELRILQDFGYKRSLCGEEHKIRKLT